MMSARALGVVAGTLLSVSLAGCGSTNAAVVEAGADASPTSPASPPGEESDASVIDAAPECVPAVMSAAVNEALISTDPATDKRVWIVRARSGETFITLTIRESGGAREGSSTGAFGPEQRAPGKAGVSLLVQTECRAHDDHFHCGPSFVPLRGTWSLARLDARAGGTLEGEISADLVQARIAGGIATPVVNGEALCLRALRLEATLTPP